MSQKFFFGPAKFNFDNPAEFFPTSSWKKSVLFPKIMEKCMFWKMFFSRKCSYGRVECSFNKPAKKTDMRPKTSAECLEMIKNFICFPKRFFFKNSFFKYGESSFDSPAKISLLNYRNWSEKSRQKMQKFFKIFFCKMFLWRIRKQLESPADFFLDSQRSFSAR